MVYSALAGGVFTGKYNDGVAPGTRFDTYKNFYKGTVENLQTEKCALPLRAQILPSADPINTAVNLR
jgi:aryl-alcohol dehydrogenase-like predicted oxidoreductase